MPQDPTHTKMLELAEKIEEKAQRWQESACEKSVTGDGSRYAIPKHAVANALMDLAHDIRSIFTPRDWREGCVVCRSISNGSPEWWGVYSPDGKYTLYPQGWIENECGEIGNNSGFYAKSSEENERDARAALASCTTPYPGYKENTCDTPSASSGVSPSIAAPTSTPAPSFPVAVVKGGASVAGGSSNTLTFGGPALRVAFHFDGDRLVRWEILEQREELRGKGIPVFYRECIRSANSPELSSRILFIRGADTKNDGNHPIYDEPDHTRASITALGAEIDQVNREWCEKLGIGEKADESELYSPPGQPDGYARAWFGVCSVANEIDSRWTNLAPTGMEAMCTMIRNLSRDRDSLRRQLDAAEKVIDTYAGLSSAARAYRTTYPKTGGAQ